MLRIIETVFYKPDMVSRVMGGLTENLPCSSEPQIYVITC